MLAKKLRTIGLPLLKTWLNWVTSPPLIACHGIGSILKSGAAAEDEERLAQAGKAYASAASGVAIKKTRRGRRKKTGTRGSAEMLDRIEGASAIAVLLETESHLTFSRNDYSIGGVARRQESDASAPANSSSVSERILADPRIDFRSRSHRGARLPVDIAERGVVRQPLTEAVSQTFHILTE